MALAELCALFRMRELTLAFFLYLLYVLRDTSVNIKTLIMSMTSSFFDTLEMCVCSRDVMPVAHRVHDESSAVLLAHSSSLFY